MYIIYSLLWVIKENRKNVTKKQKEIVVLSRCECLSKLSNDIHSLWEGKTRRKSKRNYLEEKEENRKNYLYCIR